jgi:hypothetical protein
VDGHSAARHASPLSQGRRREARKKRKEVEASVPARIARARVWLPARRKAVAEVSRRRLTSNKLGKRAPKRAAGSSERGPSSELWSAGETVGRSIERREQSRVGLIATSRESTGARPRVAREFHPAVTTSPKAVAWSRDQGCNDHWILRRVPTDRRHPGSSRGVSFHEKASTLVSAVSASSDPSAPTQRRADGQEKQRARRCSRREDGIRRSRQGCQRLGRIQRRGKKTPTLMTPGREAVEHGVPRCDDDPPKRSRRS